MSTMKCPDCHAIVPDIEGPIHAYFGASPGCWKIYGEVLAKEYSDPNYMRVHRLTVDAYAVQHPGKPEPRVIQSVNVHLLALYLIIEMKCRFKFATEALGKIIEKKKNHFIWLEPPVAPYSITVVDVARATNPEEHATLVEKWALDTWNAWQNHHEAIAGLAKEVL